MNSSWSDSNAEAMIEAYAAEGTGRDIALRVYTSRLLGGDTRLVLHGGGNASLKSQMPEPLHYDWGMAEESPKLFLR